MLVLHLDYYTSFPTSAGYWSSLHTEMCEGICTLKLESTCSLREDESPVHLTRYSFVLLHNSETSKGFLWVGSFDYTHWKEFTQLPNSSLWSQLRSIANCWIFLKVLLYPCSCVHYVFITCAYARVFKLIYKLPNDHEWSSCSMSCRLDNVFANGWVDWQVKV